MENLLTRAIKAVITGLVAGVIVALLLLVISALIPGVQIDASLWGTIIGILTALYVFVTGEQRL
jgi:TM2 domain-containing membrane protein YozV